MPSPAVSVFFVCGRSTPIDPILASVDARRVLVLRVVRSSGRVRAETVGLGFTSKRPFSGRVRWILLS
eukprot:2479011-Lingulodinium_polyedra.AAC.1